MFATILVMFHWAISLRLHLWPYARFLRLKGAWPMLPNGKYAYVCLKLWYAGKL